MTLYTVKYNDQFYVTSVKIGDKYLIPIECELIETKEVKDPEENILFDPTQN